MVLTLERPAERTGFEIDPLLPSESKAADELSERCGAGVRFGLVPVVQLAAHEPDSGRLIGVAECFRTFPPQDALASVYVASEARGQGIGTALLRVLTAAARRRGKRNLSMFLADDQQRAAWGLLRSAGALVRAHEVEGGLYVEVDLVNSRQR